MDRPLGNIITIVLTLLALVGLTYAGYNDFQDHKAGVAVDDVTQVITNARARFSQNNNGYAGFTTTNVPAMTNGGMFPTDMVRSNAVVGPWDDPVTLTLINNASQSVAGFGGDGSEIASQCMKVTTGMKDYVSLDINGQAFTQASPPDQVTTGAAYSATATFSVTFQ